MSGLTDKTFAFYTLGCKLNFAESSSIGRTLIEIGFRKAKNTEHPDICIVNTCSVTDGADKKCRQAIHKIHREHPNAYLVVTGCYAQLKPDEIIGIDGVDLVLGANDKFILPDVLNQEGINRIVSDTRKATPFFSSCSFEDRTRHFLKVQDGCDYFCTYCTIPFARGRSRNGSIKDLYAEANQVASQGGKEIILTGVNIGDFGKTTGESFLDLIKALDEIEGIERFRISSIEPDLLTDEIINFVAKSKRFAPHFHIPLQSGCDDVLKLMHRHYDTTLFAHKIRLIKEIIPDAFIGVDVIVGTRGETPEFFDSSYNFISSLDVSELHIFSYSERAGTAALRIPLVVTAQEKKRRSQLLLDLSAAKINDFYKSQIGTKRRVLWEASNKKGFMFGFTENYLKLKRPFDKAYINKIEDVIVNSDNITEVNI